MAVTTAIFKTPTVTQTTEQLADHMPLGRVWEAKNVVGSNLNGLMAGCAKPFNIRTLGKKERSWLPESSSHQTPKVLFSI